MLIQALTETFERYFDQAAHHDTVLWFDPDEEYAALLDHLSTLPLWRYAGSLLQVRYRLEQREPGQRAVVYLPLHQKEAELLRPFFATSYVFADRLYRFLRQQGLNFPDDPQVAHELRALLPRLAARAVGKGRAFWTYNLANLERARGTLIGNFDDALLRFLAGPQATLGDLKREQLDGLFFAQLESAYGLSATPDDPPDGVARRLTAQLVLVQAFTDAGQPDDFPYAAPLPPPLYFERCRAFLSRWQRDSAFRPAYVHLADALDRRYDLAGWAAGLPTSQGLALGATLAGVETALWRKVEAAIAELEREADWRDWLQAHHAPLAQRAASFWARQGRAPGWDLLARASDLLREIQAVREALDQLAAPGVLLRCYAATWWRVDRDFRVLREAIDAQATAFDWLRARCVRAYRDVLRRMNDRFCTLLASEASWAPVASSMPPQDGFWPVVQEALDAGRRVGVMFVDALRYELAQDLCQALEAEGAGDRRSVIARLAAIPTITPIGMAALLPGGDRRRVTYDDGWTVTIADSKNLSDKRARQRWLERHLPDVAFYNLDRLLDTPASRLPEKTAYVIFDTTLDAVGENASTLAWNTFSALLGAVKKGVHKLLALGVDQVHVVADHGFLLLQAVEEHEKVSARDVPALAVKSRYVVGPHLGQTDQLRLPVPGGEAAAGPGGRELVAWFPRGIGCFRTPGPYNYVHGGLSLQELLVPHLTVTQRVMGRPVKVQVTLPEAIRSAQLAITVAPLADNMFDQPRQVSLTLEKAGEPVIPPLSHVVGPDGPVELRVFLPLGCGLERGDRVRWVLRDAVTGEVLAEREAVSQVELW